MTHVSIATPTRLHPVTGRRVLHSQSFSTQAPASTYFSIAGAPPPSASPLAPSTVGLLCPAAGFLQGASGSRGCSGREDDDGPLVIEARGSSDGDQPGRPATAHVPDLPLPPRARSDWNT